MKKVICAVSLIAAGLIVFPGMSFAAANCSASPAPCPAGSICVPNPLKYGSFECLIESIINFIFVASLLLAPLMVLVGAFYLMTAGGNPARVKTAQSIFIWTAVGLLIVFMAKGLMSAIKALFGVV
ncbi:MAG: hypothetical protein Q8N16_04165 [bacterium]|nr:hypothetical protein [bacterium]